MKYAKLGFPCRCGHNPEKALKALAEHVAAAWPNAYGRPATGDDLLHTLGRAQAWRHVLNATVDSWLAKPATCKAIGKLQQILPLTCDDLRAIAEGPAAAIEKAQLLIDRKQPRWLMGWRDICRSTDERTVIASVLPRVAAANTMPLLYCVQPPEKAAVLISLLSSLTLDFVARQKLGGTHLSFSSLCQFPVPVPASFHRNDLDFITPRVLELTYTSHAMRPWAEDLGHAGPPFGWDRERRMQLRAELDGFFARKYGLTRDQLRYVLDPADVRGPDYPSETFRGLRDKEISQFGEYRTQRLVQAAYDRLEGVT